MFAYTATHTTFNANLKIYNKAQHTVLLE